MMNEKKISDMKKYLKWKNKKYLKIFALIILLVVIIFIAYEFLSENRNIQTGESADSYFPGCKLLEKNCTDTKCSFYNSCNGEQKECRIYDCGSEYGIYIKDPTDKINTKREPKPDLKAIETEKDNCSGTFQILEQACKNNKFQAKVSVKTNGACDIGSFLVTFQELGNVKSDFESLGDGSYSITVDRCGTATRIAPVTKDGMYLEF